MSNRHTAGRYIQVQIYPCSTLTLELDGWSLSHPDHFPPENRLSIQCTGGRVGLGAGQDGSEKLCRHRGSNPKPKEIKYNLQPYNTHTSEFVLIYEIKFVVILVHKNRISSEVPTSTLLIAFIL